MNERFKVLKRSTHILYYISHTQYGDSNNIVIFETRITQNQCIPIL